MFKLKHHDSNIKRWEIKKFEQDSMSRINLFELGSDRELARLDDFKIETL